MIERILSFILAAILLFPWGLVIWIALFRRMGRPTLRKDTSHLRVVRERDP